MNNKNFTIITFYQFRNISNKQILISKLKDFCRFNKIKGTILIADEGINGTIAGMEKNIKNVIKIFQSYNFFNLNIKYSSSKFMPFQKLKIKQKKEIVTLRSKYSDPEKKTGDRINFNKWNDVIKDKNILVLDVRNDYEVQMGSFKGAINPKTKNFTELKSYIKNNLNNYKDKKIAMFCTGGIRCEKASSYMIAKGFNNVYQLNGGILKYLENMPENKSLWQGECFVFDGRVSLKNELKEGTYKICHACREPIGLNEMQSKNYLPGISCPKCFKQISEDKKKRLMERKKQISIAKKRGMYNRFIKQTVTDYE